MSCRAAPWSRPSHIAGPRVPTPARPRFALGSRNLWKNSWTIGAGVSNMFALPSTLFRCMASSGSGDGDFARSTLTDEAAPFPLYSWPDKQRPRVCILGGGFGGLYTALRLESLVWPNDKRPQVLLVDQSDKFVFKPMLYELLSGVDIWEIAPSFTELLKNTSVQFVRDSVKLLRPSDHLRRKPGEPCTGGVVHLESGTVIEYDWLVLALGAEAKIDVVPGSAEYALPFTTLEDALRVESKLKMLERKRFGKSSPTIEVAIVGLGYSGVELAATISERLKNTGTVKAINVQTTVCPTAPQGNRDAALKVLESRNIQLFLGYFVSCIKEAPTSDESSSTVTYSEVDGDHRKLILDLQPAERGLKGQTLDADLVLWTVGSTSQIPRLQPPDAPYVIPLNGRGQVETEETLQVKGHPRTFAIGDSAALRDPSGKLLPATAQVAFQQADFAGWNLWAAINDRPLLPFRFQNLGEMMTLGRNDAAVTASFIEGLTLEGPLGHAARKLVYCLRMPTDEHRVKVGISWFTKAAIDSLASVQNAVASSFPPPTQMGDSTATNPSSPTAAMDPDSEVVFDFPPYLCQYKSGRIHRPGGAPTVPAGTDPATGVVSKDIRAGPASARVYLPPGAAGKIPVVVYFHGGGFVVGSPARPGTHNYLNDLVARSGAIGVSVYYRLAPEHKLPAAYDDAWAALRWAATLGGGEDPWLLEHADLSRVFLAGCSAGANIAHNTAVRASAAGALPDGVTIRGLAVVHPYFTGSEAVGGEIAFGPEIRPFMDRTWRFVVSDTVGLDDPRVNPFVDDAARRASAGIPCQRVLVCVAENDFLLKERALWYHREIKASGYAGEVELFESKGVGHAFHFDMLDSEQGVQLQERIVAFINK
uniref:demethylphylloquinone reductase n=1 Tax=Zea mays TaxID=4577 RepID=A0A804UIB7_MAIZE